MIYITGDTHGSHKRIEQIKESTICEGDILIICGDFGYVFGDTIAEAKYLDELEKLSFEICFIDGNHENFHALYQYPVEKWNGGFVHRIRRNIRHLMRGQLFYIEGKSFFTFGGAYSIDRYLRQEGVSYWEEELPSNEEYHIATDTIQKNDMRVDYILTHTVPTSMIYRMNMRPDRHDMELTGFLEWLINEVSFKHWYSGHWHIDMDLTGNFTVLLNEIVVLGEGAKYHWEYI